MEPLDTLLSCRNKSAEILDICLISCVDYIRMGVILPNIPMLITGYPSVEAKKANSGATRPTQWWYDVASYVQAFEYITTRIVKSGFLGEKQCCPVSLLVKLNDHRIVQEVA